MMIKIKRMIRGNKDNNTQHKRWWLSSEGELRVGVLLGLLRGRERTKKGFILFRTATSQFHAIFIDAIFLVCSRVFCSDEQRNEADL